MNKKFVLFFILLLVVAVLFGIYIKRESAVVSISEILPGDTLFYLNIKDIDKRLEELRSSKLWKNIKDIDIEYLLEESNVPEKTIREYKNIRAEVKKYKIVNFLNKFFGKEIALAIYLPDDILNEREIGYDWIYNIMVVTKLTAGSKIIESLSSMLKIPKDNFQITKENYEGHKFTIIDLKNFKDNIFYARFNEYLVFTLNRKNIVSCIDVVNNNASSLSEDENYINTKSRFYEGSSLMGYVNLNLVVPYITRVLEQQVENNKIAKLRTENIDQVYKNLSGLKNAGFSMVFKETVKSKGFISFDENKIDPTLLGIYSFKPTENKTLSFAPEDLLVYQWINYFDIQKILENNLGNRLPSTNKFSMPLNSTGLKIEQLDQFIGNQVGGYLSDINLAGFIPVPEILLFVEIKDKEMANDFIESITANAMLPLNIETYNGISIKYFMIPFIQKLEPRFCFLDDYLIFSTSKTLLERSINSYEAKSNSLAEGKSLKRLEIEATEKHNSMFIMNSKKMLTEIDELLKKEIKFFKHTASNIKEMQKRTKKNVEKIETEIKKEEIDRYGLRAKIQVLKAELSQAKLLQNTPNAEEPDLTSKKEELRNLEKRLKDTEANIETLKMKGEKQKQQIARSKEKFVNKFDFFLIEVYLNEVVYPIFAGLKEIYEIVLTRSVFDKHEIKFFTNYR